jgi:hypothetical protein
VYFLGERDQSEIRARSERDQSENEEDGETITTEHTGIKKLSTRFFGSADLLVTQLAVRTYHISVIHSQQVVMTFSPANFHPGTTEVKEAAC